MLNESESAELRMLQAKAYGRGGSLSDVEFERLQALERPVRPVAECPAPAASQPALIAPQEVDSPERADSPHKADLARVVERVEASEPAQTHQPRHPLVSFLVAAVGLALILGVGIGWFLFGRDAGPAIPITAEQQVRGEQLAEEAELDPGTLTPMAEDHDVLVWMGTRDEGNITCLIIDDGEHDAPSCAQTDSVHDTGLYGVLSRDSPDSSENGTEMISASLGFARKDEPIVIIPQGWTTSSNGSYLDHFTDPGERATAERLLDGGFDPWSPMLAAYDGDTPIWIGTRENGQEVCLLYGDEPDAPGACGSIEAAQTTGVGMSMPKRDGDTAGGVSLLLRYTAERSPSIVISPMPDVSDFTVDPESGDPIEFTFEGPTSDDLLSDGETGETGG